MRQRPTSAGFVFGRHPRAPVATVAVRVDDGQADSRAFGAVFTHEAVGVRSVRRVFGHQGHGKVDLLQMVDGALDLGETRRKNSRS